MRKKSKHPYQVPNTRQLWMESLEAKRLLTVNVKLSTLVPAGPLDDGIVAMTTDEHQNLYTVSYEDYDVERDTWTTSLTKQSPEGELIWEQRGFHWAYEVHVDSQGYVYMFSPTFESTNYDSRNLPVTPGAIQSSKMGEADGYFIVLDGMRIDDDPDSLSDDELVYASYIGGSGEFHSDSSIAIDANGNVYLSGVTKTSSQLVVTNQPFVDSDRGGAVDGFITKLRPSPTTGFEIEWSTYYGGERSDVISEIVVDGNGVLHVAGTTGSQDFPITPDAHTTDLNDRAYHAFLSRISPDGELLYSTYIAGIFRPSIAVDSTGASYLAGETDLPDYVPVNAEAFQPESGGGRDAVLAKFNAEGELSWATYYGGSGWEQFVNLVIDSDESPIIVGHTRSADLPLQGAWQEEYAGDAGNLGPGNDRGDIFVARFSDSGEHLSAASYLGGEDTDYVEAYAPLPNGDLLIAGTTLSQEFPTTDGSTRNGNADGFLARLGFGEPGPLPGDANGDNDVTFADFLVLSQNFGKQADAVFAEGDFDGNGAVDFADFLILSANFDSSP